MIRLVLVAAAVGAQLACAPCGSYVISNTAATDYEGNGYNGHWREQCGALYGATGVWDWSGGFNEIWFSPDAAGERSWQGIDVEITLGFPVDRTKPGEEIDAADMYGGAALNPCIDCRQDMAGLTGGTLRVLDGWEGDDPCEPEDGPTLRFSWDLTYGDGVGPTYEVQGADQITLSTFTTEACSSW